MRSLSVCCTALVAGLVLTTATPAGVYNTMEFEGILHPDYRTFRDGLIPLRQNMGGAVNTPDARRYLLLAELAADSAAAKMSDEVRLNLGAYLIRLGKYQEAGRVLNPLKFEDRKHFLAYSNRATADFLLGVSRKDARLLGNAAEYLQAALKFWPKDYAELPKDKRESLELVGWNEQRLKKFQRAEVYFQRLIKSRRQPTKHPLGDDVDALFGEPGQPVQFVGDSGKYEPGKLAAAEKAKLPPDALEIVEQLVLWMPQDMRLNWLLGELFNSQGDMDAALEIFKGIGVTEKYHHEVWGLFHYRPPGVSELDTLGEIGSRTKLGYPPVLLDHVQKLLAYQKNQANPDVKPGPVDSRRDPLPNSKPDPKEEPPLDLRTLGVGFGFGLLAAFFGYWQYHEVRRRRGK